LDIDIEEEKIVIQSGETKISVSGILSKKHAIILVSLILAILGIKEFDIPI
tara:strand:+ start:2098 stop:2250 length:153 start_codon:yes stop_codon:yes gene_type:complete